MTKQAIQPPAVAGLFYSRDPDQLTLEVEEFIAAGNSPDRAGVDGCPKAIIAPHAGYIYSGVVAGSAYATLSDYATQIERVVLLGPPHRFPVRSIATSNATAFETPLGRVPVDQAEVERLLAVHPVLSRVDAAFFGEHCIEVQLPFLQALLDHFTLIPLLVGSAGAGQVADLLEPYWNQDGTLIVVSSDLSHYLDYANAQALDRRTSDAIVTLHPERIAPEQACGCNAIAGLLRLAKRHGARGRLLDLRNSGDTAGPRDRVVGYGAYAFL
jgi:AmmeMemoRadiSam system protein B